MCLLTRSRISCQISDMKAAGSSEKDIKTATLAFKRQEALFQEKLKSVSSTFDEDHERKELLQMKAKQELAKVNLNTISSQGGLHVDQLTYCLTRRQFKVLRAKEHARQATAEHKYQAEQAKERAEAEKTADDIMHERQQVATVQKQAHSYEQDLKKEGTAEDKRQDSLEARIRLAKRKEALHSREMQEKAVAEVTADQAVHAGEKPDEKVVASSKAVSEKKKGEPEVKVKDVTKKQQHTAAAEAAHGKKEEVKKVKKGKPAAGTGDVAATRQAAFLKALSQQADAEFQSMPQSV